MTIQQRRILAVVGGCVVLLSLVLVLTSGGGSRDEERLTVAGGDEDATKATTSTVPPADPSSATTVPLVPLTTGVPVPEAEEPPPTTEPPSATPAAPSTTTAAAAKAGAGSGTVAAAGSGGTGATGAAGTAGGASPVGATGAVLTRSPSGATRTVDKAKGCTSAGAAGWKMQDCGALRTSGTVLLWLVETKGKTSRALVLKEQPGGRWAVVLSAVDTDGSAYSKIGVRGEDVDGDGNPELAFGFHRRDAARTLAVDVVDAAPAVVVHRDLVKGSVQLAKGEIRTWSAAGDGMFDQVVIRPTSSGWRASAPQRVPASAVPASMI